MKKDTVLDTKPWQAMDLRKLPASAYSPVHWRCACNDCGFYSTFYDTPTEAVAAVLDHWNTAPKGHYCGCATHVATRG